MLRAIMVFLSAWMTTAATAQTQFHVLACPGMSQGQTFKAGNSFTSSVRISGFVVCTDRGDAFEYKIRFMHYHMLRDEDGVGTAHANWFGMFLKDGRAGPDSFIYDEAKPVSFDISVRKSGLFGRMSFSVPKSMIARAKVMGFYTTVNGVAMIMWLL